MSRPEISGKEFEDYVFKILVTQGYNVLRQQCIGLSPKGGKHIIDLVVTKPNLKILISLKYQAVSGTAEEKIPYEIIKLIHSLESKIYDKAYLVLEGKGFNSNLMKFYLNDLQNYINIPNNLEIVSLEALFDKLL